MLCELVGPWNKVVSRWKDKGAGAGGGGGANGVSGSKTKKHRVVILGGGMSGAFAACSFDSDPEERFHVTLVDPKNYFEDVTARPGVLVHSDTPHTVKAAAAMSPAATFIRHVCFKGASHRQCPTP